MLLLWCWCHPTLQIRSRPCLGSENARQDACKGRKATLSYLLTNSDLRQHRLACVKMLQMPSSRQLSGVN